MLATASDSLEVLLQFAFLAVLYLFLLWVVSSALRDMRRPVNHSPEGLAPFPGDESESRRGWLVVEAGGGLKRGDSFDVGPEITIGRSADCAVRIDDSFASGRHARVHNAAGVVRLEDLDSTNGTYLNDRRVDGVIALQADDVIRIGDTELRYEE